MIMLLLITICIIVIIVVNKQEPSCQHIWELKSSEKYKILDGRTNDHVGFKYIYEYKCLKCNEHKIDSQRI